LAYAGTMLPSSRLFRSRWAAVLWAAGILWVAYDVAQDNGGKPRPATGNSATDVTGTAVDDSDARNTISALDSIKG
jgi:hypothetical protein